MFAENLIVPGSLRNLSDRTGYALDIRLNWFRSLPVSCVEELGLAVDGAPARVEDVVLIVRDEPITLSDTAERDDVWWSCRAATTVEVRGGAPLPAGSHELSLELRVRIPYFPPTAPGGPSPSMYDRTTRSETIR